MYITRSVLPIEWTDQHGCVEIAQTVDRFSMREDTLILEDDFPWVQNSRSGSAYRGKQHFARVIILHLHEMECLGMLDGATEHYS